MLETVKLADDRDGDVVVRLYECLGGRATTVLRPGFPLARVAETDLLERPLTDAPAHLPESDGTVRLRLRPFQILTLRLTPTGDRLPH